MKMRYGCCALSALHANWISTWPMKLGKPLRVPRTWSSISAMNVSGTSSYVFLASPDPGRGLWMLYELGILMRVIPELRGSDRLPQGKPNAPTLLDHLIQTVAMCPDDPLLRLAALLHDVGKLHTRDMTETGQVIFHRHEVESARIAEEVLRRLRFDTRSVERVVSLIRHHMAHGPVTRKNIRRWLSAYDEQWVRQVMALRHADHLASGGSHAPWLDLALTKLETVLSEGGALHLKDLCLNGDDVMRILNTPPGPIVGYVLKGSSPTRLG